MSEKSKGSNDTYAASVTPTRFPNNPLLSASVTGLTIDDYPNKPLLLPAAPPIVYAPIPSPSLATIGGETKALVTVGKSSNIDSECLDEINLNTPAEETLRADIDINSNPLFPDPNQTTGNTDSILSQAALSFSALPSVASTVLSTFSKRLYAGSNSREQTPDIHNPHSINYDGHTSTANVQGTPPPPNVATFFAPPSNINNNNNIYESNQFVSPQSNLSENQLNQPFEPPKLYAPSEVLSKASVPTPPLAVVGGQNTYRLTAKKKLYAPIPGLSGQPGQFPAEQAPPQLAPNPHQINQANATLPQQPEAEERKGGLFSFSNLAPTGLLQNISGLVTGTVQKPNEQIYPTAAQGDSQPFAETFFNPPGRETIIASNGQSLYNPTVGALSSTANVPLAPGAPLTAPTQSGIPNSKPEEIFEPPQISSIPHQTFVPNENHIKAAEIKAIGVELAPANQSGVNFFSQPQPATSVPSLPPINTGSPLVGSAPPPALPPAKPSNASGPGSFRLQKGTKLYANPLTAAELAPVSALAEPTAHSSVTAFNPFQPPPNLPAVSTSNFFIPNAGTTSQAQEFPTQQIIVPATTSATVESSLNIFQPTPTSNLNAVNFFATNQTTDLQQIQQPTHITPPPVQPIIPTETKQQTFYQPFGFTQPTQQPHLFSIPQTQQIEPTAPPLLQEEQQANTSPLSQVTELQPLPIKQEYVQQLDIDNNTREHQPIESVAAQPIENQFSTTSDIFAPSTTAEQAGNAIFEKQIIEPVVTADEATETFEKNTEVDPLEETVNKLVQKPPSNNILASSFNISNNIPQVAAASFPTPPVGVKGVNNPFRRNSGVTALPVKGPSTNLLASFFTPVDPTSKEAGDFNIFAVTPRQEIEREKSPVADLEQNNGTFFEEIKNKQIEIPALPTFTSIAPPALSQEVGDNSLTLISAEGVPPPIGFDNFITDLKETTSTESTTNSINFFNQLSNTVNADILQSESKQQEKPQQQIGTKSFFDNLTTPTISSQHQHKIENSLRSGNEEQILQNFFNNPPLSESNANGIDDLNYAILQSGCTVKEIEDRSFSNIVEPASSEACSEFSELNNSSSLLNRKSQLTEQAGKLKSEKVEIDKKEINNINFETQTSEECQKSKETLQNIDSTDTFKFYAELPEYILKEFKMANLLIGEKGAATDPPPAKVSYKPATKHWFFKQTLANKCQWLPFSHFDSELLEKSLEDSKQIVPVEGGRYDVNISDRTKVPVYWQGEPIEVRRCSWFYKGTDSKYVPYEEQTSELLEIEYKAAAESGEWHKKVLLARGEQVVFHGPTIIVHFQQQSSTDAWGGTTQSSTRPRVVRRDLEDFTIDQGESQKVDHLLFMVHGIGSACDLRMRSVEEVVEDFRSIAANLVKSHYKNSYEAGIVGRVEVLPISWHGHLHSTEMGIDEKLKSITLESIPKLRNFTNDTLLDVLFYTSPTFCQKIINTVSTSLNEVYVKYCQRNPQFNGGVSLAGHSLGSLILFDLLCNQLPLKESEAENMENPDGQFTPLQLPASSAHSLSSEMGSNQISYTAGASGTGQPFINYPQLIFQPKKFFALGSPIGMFITIRGIDTLGLDFRLPTCSGFYNIFHPFDPVAYRIEALLNPDLSGVRPVLIPHHKGRKRMHLELKETMTRVSADIKQRFMDTFKTTFDSVYFLGSASKKSEPEVEENMTNEVNKVLDMQTQQEAAVAAATTSQQHNDLSNTSQISMRSRTDSTSSNAQSEHEIVELDLPLGKLNDAKRVDYVLQEAPLEFFNDYIFALSSHVCYWDSADTILFVMKEIYMGLGVVPDNKVPQQSLTIERPNSRNSTTPHSSP